MKGALSEHIQVSDSIDAILPLEILIALHDDVFVLEVRNKGGDWGLEGPNMALCPFHEASEFLPVSQFRDGANNAYGLAKFELQEELEVDLPLHTILLNDGHLCELCSEGVPHRVKVIDVNLVVPVGEAGSSHEIGVTFHLEAILSLKVFLLVLNTVHHLDVFVLVLFLSFKRQFRL